MMQPIIFVYSFDMLKKFVKKIIDIKIFVTLDYTLETNVFVLMI